MKIWTGKLRSHTCFNWYDKHLEGFTPYWKRAQFWHLRQNNGLLEAL